MGPFPQGLARIIDRGAHQPVPEQNGEIVGPGIKGTVMEEPIIRRGQGVVEDDAVGDGGEVPQLVQGAEHVHVGGSPGISATAGVARLGHPHLAAGAVLVPSFGVEKGVLTGHRQIRLGQGLFHRPVAFGHERSQPLGNAIVVVVAVHIQLFPGALHQLLQADHFAQHVRDSAAPLGTVVGFQTAGVAGPHQQALGVIGPHPGEEQILIPGVVGRGVALGAAAVLHHVGLVHELGRVDGHAILFAEGENLLGLRGVPGFIRSVDAGTVGHRDQQFASHRLDEIQQAQPLGFGQHVLEALGSFALHGAVEVVVGLAGPCAGDSDPHRAECPRQAADLLPREVNGGIDLHQPGHLPQVLDGRELLGARNLGGGVLLPEGAAGDLGHLDVVGHETGVHLPQLLQGGRIQLDSCCHNRSPFDPGKISGISLIL